MSDAATRGGHGHGATTRIEVDGVRVSMLCDADGPFLETRHHAFPDATGAAWEAARRIDPGVFGPGDQWHLHFHVFLVEAGGDIVLVDLGVGPHDSVASSWAPVPGRLPAALDAEGIAPADVDLVVITHVHSDHVAWALDGDQPRFENARHVVQQAEIEDPGDAALLDGIIVPLQRAGVLDVVDGEHRVAHRVSVIPTPGHTLGHQSVTVGDRLVLTGDVLVHPVQLVDPTVAYHFEADPDLARASRTRLLTRATERGATLGIAHLAVPFVAAPPPLRDGEA